MSVSESLQSLKKNQIVSLIKDVKDVLQLNTTGKSKPVLIKDLLAIHGSPRNPNLFMGKKLLGFDNTAHIVIPGRAAKVDRKAIKAEKEKAAKDTRRKQLSRDIEVSKARISAGEARQKELRAKIQSKTQEQLERTKSVVRTRNFNLLIKEYLQKIKGASPKDLARLRKEFMEAKRKYDASKK